jgi:Domain of unknown function (DUF4375)
MADRSLWELYERLARSEVASLSPAQRRFVAVGSLRTEVNNGGFHQYFFNSAVTSLSTRSPGRGVRMPTNWQR